MRTWRAPGIATVPTRPHGRAAAICALGRSGREAFGAVRGRHQALRRRRALSNSPVARHLPGRILRAARAVGLRQDHAAAHAGRLRERRTKAAFCSTARTSPPCRRTGGPVNMMFQSYALFPHLTVAGNVAFGLRQDRLPKAEIAARVDEMLALVKLEGLGARKPRPAVRRPAPARGARARAGQASARSAARRAAGGARQEAARGDPVRADATCRQRLGTDLRDRHP